VICGKSFEVTKGRAKAAKACSKKCASILMGRTQSKQVTLICKVCGSSFKVPLCRAETATTCSDECAISVRAKSRERKVTCVCKNCGKKFESPQSVAGRRIYCSVICQFSDEDARQERSVRVSGINNPMWKGGITPRSVLIRCSSDYAIWRSSVFERDNYTCRECGERGGKLNAHHINSFAKYPELRLVVDNGITLCEACHRKKHFNINTGLLFEQRPRLRINLLSID